MDPPAPAPELNRALEAAARAEVGKAAADPAAAWAEAIKAIDAARAAAKSPAKLRGDLERIGLGLVGVIAPYVVHWSTGAVDWRTTVSLSTGAALAWLLGKAHIDASGS